MPTGTKGDCEVVTASHREMRASKNLTTLLNDALNEPVTITPGTQILCVAPGF